MKRSTVACLVVAYGALAWSTAARADDVPRHFAYLPYLRRDATPTSFPTPDPLSCGTILSDPSLETALDDPIQGPNATINLFPDDGLFSGVIDGENWITATRGRFVPLNGRSNRARTGRVTMSFLGDGTVGFGMIMAKESIAVKTDDSVISAAVSLWYKLTADSESGFDRMVVEAIGFPGHSNSAPTIGIQVAGELSHAASAATNEWTHEVIDFTPFANGFQTRGKRWDVVALRFAMSDGDGALNVSSWLIDDVQMHVCFRDQQMASGIFRLKPEIAAQPK